MKTLLIGDMNQLEALYPFLEQSDTVYEILCVISENKTDSSVFHCPIVNSLNLSSDNDYEKIIIMSQHAKIFLQKLTELGISKEIICDDYLEQLSKCEKMLFYKTYIRKEYYMIDILEKNRAFNFQCGDFTYLQPSTEVFGGYRQNSDSITIGSYCSLSENVQFLINENHRTDWATTYPFNEMLHEFGYISGSPTSHGDIIIGNDVWIGKNVVIMSGVTIGDGSVVATGAIVTKDIEPYSIVGGVPAKKIGKRFDDSTIEQLLNMQWWNWREELIYDAIPLLQSQNIKSLIEYYHKNVK